MKKIVIVFLLLFFASCSSIRFVDSWRNKEISTFQPKKVLIIGMTDNLTARKIFEETLKNELTHRNINAVESTTVLDDSFTNSKKSEEEINEMKQQVAEKGFDAIIITAVKGVDEKINYTRDYYTYTYKWTRFGRYYFRYQDVYYTPKYYEAYKVYNVETAIYIINGDENKSLVWVGALNLVDPQTISTTVKDYVFRIVKQLEREKLIQQL